MSNYRDIALRLVAFLALMAVIVSAETRELVAIPIAVFIVLASSISLPGARFESIFSRLYGFITPLIAWVGSGVLLALGLVFFVLRPATSQSPHGFGQRGRSWSLLWAAPLLALVSGSLISELVIALDLVHGGRSGVFNYVTLDGPNRVLDLARAILDVHITSWAFAVRLFLLALLVGLFSESLEARFEFMRGLLVGTTIAALYAIVQWLVVGPVSVGLPNQTPLWTALNRVSGSMSDPNALGIVMALVIWLWFGFREKIGGRPLHVAIIFIAGIVSSSRTFALSMTILALWLGWVRYGRRSVALGCAILLMAVFGVSYVDSSSSLLSDIVSNSAVPGGVRRVLSALSIERLSDTLFSRGVFLQIAQAIGDGRWIWGVGADRFSEYVALVGAERDIIRGWVDNSNNFYVGLLVELGVIGLACFLLTCAGRCLVGGNGRRFAVGVIGMLALILITGPHTDFSEVLVIIAVILGATTAERRYTAGIIGRAGATVGATVACVGGVLAASLGHEYGTYNWIDTRLGATRWLAHRARVRLECKAVEPSNPESSKTARSMLRAVYVPQTAPLIAKVYTGVELHQELIFTKSEHKEVVVECSPQQRAVYLTIHTQPAWSPYRAWPTRSPDHRLFGLEQPTRPPNFSGTW
jgi:hypothetical protein